VTDYAAAYHGVRERVTDLIGSHGSDVDTIAPATPQWRVRDVVSHLAGICDDILNGNLDGVGTDRWTAAQVDKRRDWTVDRILTEWDEQGSTVEQMMSSFPGVTVGQMVYDAATHEHDIRSALDEAGARDSEAVAIGYDWGTDRFGEAVGDMTTFTFVTELGAKTVGSGEPASTLHASRFEVIRAFTGRRSMAQMRSYRWEGTPQAERLVLADLFHPPGEDLIE